MKETQRDKFVSEIDQTNQRLRARRPFRVSSENRRRFIRLEINAPMEVNRIKDIFGQYWPHGEGEPVEGTILNISSGGVLVEIRERLNEGDIVGMNFVLQDVEQVKNVLGIIKRTDDEEDYQLVGIEFTTREKLADKLSEGEMEMLRNDYNNFRDSVQDVLRHYVYSDSEAV